MSQAYQHLSQCEIQCYTLYIEAGTKYIHLCYRQKTFGKGEDRRIHVSRYAFKTLHEHIMDLMRGMKGDGEEDEEQLPRVKLTKSQLATVTVFQQNRMRYLTVSYEKDDGELDFSRTINLSPEEATAFERVIPQICEVLNYAEYLHSTMPDNDIDEQEVQITTMQAYMLAKKDGSVTNGSDNLFINERNARMALCDMEDKSLYTITPVTVHKPSKYAIVEYILREEMMKKAVQQQTEMTKEVYTKLDQTQLRVMVIAALKETTYKWPLFAEELIGAFVYCGGLDKIVREGHLPPQEYMDAQDEALLRAVYHEALTRV